jgi:hypothetical protein
MTRPFALRLAAVLLWLTALGTLLFWAAFFADLDAQRGGVLASRSQHWFAWEMSFPLADAWLAGTAALAAVGLWRQRPAGLLSGLLSGSALVFLGLMDTLFFLQNRLYRPLTGEVAVELFIHLWALALGGAVIVLVWRQRAVLGG